MLSDRPVLLVGACATVICSPFEFNLVVPPPSCTTWPALSVALGRIAPIAETRAALLARSVPSAWIAWGEFCWAIRIASSSEILRALSGARACPGWGAGFKTWGAAIGAAANSSTVAANSIFGVNDLGIMDRTKGLG